MRIEWDEIENMFEKSKNTISVEKSNNRNQEMLNQLIINEQSVLGQIVLNISQITVNGYLRVLGGKNIVPINDCIKKYHEGNKLIVAYDIFGGIYAIGNGDFEGNKRNIWYFAPDSLEWEALEINYPQFIAWICSDDIKAFYIDFIWNGIENIINDIEKDQVILIYPFLWATEYNIEVAKKTLIPLEELIAINADYRKRLIMNSK